MNVNSLRNLIVNGLANIQDSFKETLPYSEIIYIKQNTWKCSQIYTLSRPICISQYAIHGTMKYGTVKGNYETSAKMFFLTNTFKMKTKIQNI